MEDFGELISNLTQNAKASLVSADLWSQVSGSSYIGTEHLLMGILAQPEAVATRFLNDMGVTFDKVRDLLGVKSSVNMTDFTAVKVLSESARLSLGMGWSVAREYNQKHLGTEHILFALLEQKNSQAHALLVKLNIDIETLYDQLRQYFDRQLLELTRSELDTKAFVGAQKQARRQSLLARYGTSLNQLALAGKLDPVVAREREIERLVTTLSRRTKSNPVLVGEAGVGKSAIVEGLAQRIVAGKVPRNLLDAELIELDLTALVAGTKFRGEFEERLHKIMAEIKRQPQIILFIDELHMLVGAGSSEGSSDAANILKPALARGQIKLIGATTFEDYRKFIEKDAALERRLQRIEVAEPSRAQAIGMLKGVAKRYAKHHQVVLSNEVLEAAVDLSSRYLAEKFLPDKAIDLIDEAAAMAQIKYNHPSAEQRKKVQKINLYQQDLAQAIEEENYQAASEVKLKLDCLTKELDALKTSPESTISLTRADLAAVVSLMTGVPATQIKASQQNRLLNLERILAKRVVGQTAAVTVVAQALKRARSGVRPAGRPIGSFIFMGPSGVGKTELAKVLADEMFGGEKSLIKIDMSEFSERHSISGLIGAPAGYVGYDDGAKLTDAVRRKPYSVVLFDEIEKASSEIYNILLQILEDGYLTDSKGRRVDFSNTIIILTSNLGSEELVKTEGLGFGKMATHSDEAVTEQALAQFMRPELINRFDEIVVFKPLMMTELNKIATIMLNDLRKHLQKLGFGLEVKASLKQKIVRLALAKQAGARPLRRLIESQLEQPISLAMIAGKLTPGDTIELGVDKRGEVKMKTKNNETCHVAKTVV